MYIYFFATVFMFTQLSLAKEASHSKVLSEDAEYAKGMLRGTQFELDEISAIYNLSPAVDVNCNGQAQPVQYKVLHSRAYGSLATLADVRKMYDGNQAKQLGIRPVGAWKRVNIYQARVYDFYNGDFSTGNNVSVSLKNAKSNTENIKTWICINIW